MTSIAENPRRGIDCPSCGTRDHVHRRRGVGFDHEVRCGECSVSWSDAESWDGMRRHVVLTSCPRCRRVGEWDRVNQRRYCMGCDISWRTQADREALTKPEPYILASKEARPLLATIAERPADDGPRLVFVDFLKDRCEEDFAEFIRVQVELAGMTCSPLCNLRAAGVRNPGCVCERGLHRAREAELLARHGREWAEALMGPALPGWKLTATSGWSVDSTPGITIVFSWHRGFPARFSVPTLATWRGRECDRMDCFNEEGDGPSEDCPRCSGTGLVGGIGPALCRALPVEYVEIGDKRPIYSEGDPVARWISQRAGREATNYDLPDAIFQRLPTGPDSGCILIRDAGVNWRSAYSIRDYDSIAAAQQALSDASIAEVKGAAHADPR